MIHSSSTSLFRSSFLSYFTVTLPCFFWTGSSPAVMGPDPTQLTPDEAWKKTRLPAVGSGALVSVLAADIAGGVNWVGLMNEWGFLGADSD